MIDQNRTTASRSDLERLREAWELVAHDLHQPVNAILLGTELVMRGALDDRQRDMIRRIASSANHLVRLISDLTDVENLEAGKLSLQMSEVDLAALVRQVAGQDLELARRVVLRAPEAGPQVTGDPDRLEQVVENLLTNAAKYSTAGTEVDVDLETLGAYAQITVTNRGPGIRAEELATVFDRYVRTQGAVESRAKGSGLGLFITRGLVEAHGGQVWAESEPGRVTRFHVWIPIVGPAYSEDGAIRGGASDAART